MRNNFKYTLFLVLGEAKYTELSWPETFSVKASNYTWQPAWLKISIHGKCTRNFVINLYARRLLSHKGWCHSKAWACFVVASTPIANFAFCFGTTLLRCRRAGVHAMGKGNGGLSLFPKPYIIINYNNYKKFFF